MSFLGLGKNEKKETKAGVASGKTGPGGFFVSGLIKKPMISEKALAGEAKGEYVFEVFKSATKPEIKKEVERKYGVKVFKVNMVVFKPKSKLYRGKPSMRSGFKKAVVKLEAGHKLELNSK